MIRNDAVITGFLQQNDIKIVETVCRVKTGIWIKKHSILIIVFDKNPELIDGGV
jgi:hypothetical protein